MIDLGTITQQDAITWMDSLVLAGKLSSFDLAIVDPPYDSLEGHRAKGTTTRLTNQWFPVMSPNQVFDVMVKVSRLLSSRRHAYFFLPEEYLLNPKLSEALERSEFNRWRVLVWDKQAMGMGYPYRRSHELLLWCAKGSKPECPRNVRDILKAKRVRSKDAYPTEKPIELIDQLMGMSAIKGGRCLDPFSGSGVVAESATRHGMRYFGCDISAAAIARTMDRLSVIHEVEWDR